MKEQYRELQEYNNQLLLKQSSLKEELTQKRGNLEKVTGERENAINSISLLENKMKALSEEIGSIDKQYNDLLNGSGNTRAEIDRLAATSSNLGLQYNDLSLACERIKGEISQLETSRNNAQQQYDNTLATNGQIKMEIAKRDNAQNTYNSMVNHNTVTNNQISNMALERDNLQNNYINPYINALQEARNARGILAFETVKTIKMVDLFDFREVEERKYADKYYHIVEKKHKVKGLFGITIDPKYTYHREFNKPAYDNDVITINSRISNAENQLNVQKANYQGKINTLSTEISSKQSSLYSPVLLEQALQTLNTAQYAVSSRGITLETSEQQVANSLQILKDTSSALKSKQADLAHNEQQKVQVAESVTITSNMIHAHESDLRDLEQKAVKTDSNLKEKQAMYATVDKELRDYLVALENLESDLSNIQKELLTLEEASRANEQEITASGEKLETVRVKLERLEAEKIKAEQLEIQRLEAQKLANTEKVEIVDDIFGVNENQILDLEQAVVKIDLSGDV